MATIRFLSAVCAAAVAAPLAMAIPAAAQSGETMQKSGQKGGAMHGGMPRQSLMQRVEKWNRDLYIRYQMAVQAQEYCRSPLSESAMRAVTERIESETGEPLSPGMKLKILDDAKSEMRKTLIEEGCAADRAKDALRTLDMDLAEAMRGGGIMMQ